MANLLFSCIVCATLVWLLGCSAKHESTMDAVLATAERLDYLLKTVPRSDPEVQKTAYELMYQVEEVHRGKSISRALRLVTKEEIAEGIKPSVEKWLDPENGIRQEQRLHSIDIVYEISISIDNSHKNPVIPRFFYIDAGVESHHQAVNLKDDEKTQGFWLIDRCCIAILDFLGDPIVLTWLIAD